MLEDFKAMPERELFDSIRHSKKVLGDRLLILGHHYQRDEIIQFADITGDSYGLSRQAAETPAEYIVFCGVHFMAESADILTRDEQTVILPDLKAGCSMADMANIDEVQWVWDELNEICTSSKICPITYVNSDAELKAFVGRAGGTVCTSSNAKKVIEWAFSKSDKVFFLPDQHLGRNTAYFDMKIPLEQIVLWDHHKRYGGLDKNLIKNARVILWNGFCSVHQNFLPRHIDVIRKEYPGMKVIVHPECRFDVVEKADEYGSTAKIINVVQASPPSSEWAIGTEQHLVFRLKKKFPGKEIIFLSPCVCSCSTMYRIDPVNLAHVLFELTGGNVVNRIKVSPEIKKDALTALKRMLDIS